MFLDTNTTGWNRLFFFCLIGVIAPFLSGCAVSGGGVSQQTASASLPANDPSSYASGQSQNVVENRAQITSAEHIRRSAGVKVAMLLPVSARNKGAVMARALKQAGELALFDFDNPNIVLVTKDTKGTAEGAKAAAQEAIASGAQIILGPLYARSVAAVASVTKPKNIPVIAFSSDGRVASEGVYLQSFLPGRDVERIVAYAISQGKRRFAAMIPQTAYGKIVEENFRAAVQKNGGEIVVLEHCPLNPNGMMKPMEHIATYASNKDGVVPRVDAIFLPFGRNIIPTLSPLLSYFEIDTKVVKVLGTGRWDYATIGREKTLINGWFPAPDPKGWRRFNQKYVTTYGKAPPRIASLSYDAVSLAVALSNNPSDQRFSQQELTRSSGFSGVDGLFRLRKDGTLDRALAILEVKKLGSHVIDQAATVFGIPAQY